MSVKVCMKLEPDFAARLIGDQACVKDEPELITEEAACVKEEACADSTRVGLYSGHVVKNDHGKDELAPSHSLSREPSCGSAGATEAAVRASVPADLVNEPALSRREPSCAGVSELAVLAGLYADHVVKDELVLGPEHPHRPEVGLVVHSWVEADADGCFLETPQPRATTATRERCSVKDCYVRLERLAGDVPYSSDYQEPTPENSPNDHSDSSHNEDIWRVEKTSIISSDGEFETKDYITNYEKENTNFYVPTDCYVQLQRITYDAPLVKSKHLTVDYDNSFAASDSINIAEEDEDRKELCYMCGERFYLKSDLLEHVLVHIHMPVADQEATRCGVDPSWALDPVDECSGQSSNCGDDAQLPLKDCWVKLERLHHEATSYEHRNVPQEDCLTDKESVEDLMDADSKNECDLCGERFALKSVFLKHIMNHIYMPVSNEEQLECNFWPNAIQSQPGTDLRLKIDTVTVQNIDLNTYICDICGKVFQQKNSLFRHIQLHTLKKSCVSNKPKININQVERQEKCFICDVCDKICTQKVHLVIHMRRHTGEKPYGCDVCKKRFTHSAGLMYHKRTHTGEKPYTCVICKKRFRYLHGLKSHMIVHTGEKLYSCNICEKRYTGSTALNNHILTHLGVLFSCDICHKGFKKLAYLKTHQLIHEGVKPYFCNICFKKFRHLGGLRTHEQIHKTERPYWCDICGRTFKQSSSLRCHKFIHSRKPMYSCDICQNKFSRAGSLITHKLIHSGEKRHSCEICKKKFTQRGHLIAHRSVHSTVKAYSCETCHKKFKTSDHLKKHKIIHSEVKQYYTCEICGKKFNRRSGFKSHKQIHTGEKPFSCEICQKRFRRSSHLQLHKRMHAGEKPYKCDICEMKFTQASNARKHKLLVHSKPHSCQLCHKQFNNLIDLEKHQRFHDSDKPYCCEICKYTFTRRENLLKHEEIHRDVKAFSCKICNKQFRRRDAMFIHKRCHTSERPFSCSECDKRYKCASSLQRHLLKHA